jgi:hypothetical protein
MTTRLTVTVRKLIGLAGVVSLLLVVRATPARAQAVELFAGDDAATVDVMFFNYFKDAAGQPSPVLLFHRSRVLVNYDIDSSSRRHLPQFGMTNAVSYNPEALRGFAPVVALSITTSTAASKVGLQYARVRPTHTLFGWVVSETHARPAIDVFLLGRYVHPITPTVGLFTQLESVSVLPAEADARASFTVRSRLGIDVARWQFGVGADVRRSTGAASAAPANVGIFTRYAF